MDQRISTYGTWERASVAATTASRDRRQKGGGRLVGVTGRFLASADRHEKGRDYFCFLCCCKICIIVLCVCIWKYVHAVVLHTSFCLFSSLPLISPSARILKVMLWWNVLRCLCLLRGDQHGSIPPSGLPSALLPMEPERLQLSPPPQSCEGRPRWVACGARWEFPWNTKYENIYCFAQKRKRKKLLGFYT